MSEKQYLLVECYNQMWGIYDKKQSETDNPVLIAYSKARVGFIVNQLNNKNERIKELEKENKQLQIEVLGQSEEIEILSDENQQLKERNQRQYNRLKEITDLMFKRDWKTLEQIADEWEKQEELLQAEWGTYCGDKE